MKRTFTLFAVVLLTALISAQVPEKMSYQAVIRNSSDQLVTSQEVGLRVSILLNSIEGTVVYQEIYNPNPKTNKNGLLTIEIGAGVPLTGKFSEIDWSDGPFFLKTEVDPSGGTTYTITGTSQLLSVPYALHSKSSETLTGKITESQIDDLQDYLTGISDQPIGDLADVELIGLETGMVLQYDEQNEHWNASYENDPLFAASPASGIDQDDMENWNGAYSWGDHSEGGYVTEVSAGTGLSGGATSGGVTLSIDGTVVRTSGDQSIGGNKTFTGSTTVAEPVNSNDAATKAYVDNILRELGFIPYNYSGTITDINGNVYKTITIGTQTWMAENLRATNYSDGTAITLKENATAWGDPSPAYCWYDNNYDVYGTVYGAIYNWYAVDVESNNGKNVCPTGWHVPTLDEWNTLQKYLEINGYNYDGTTEGNKYAKSLAAIKNWVSSTVEGAVGNNDYPEKRNITGFTALPGGRRWGNGTFDEIGRSGNMWSVTESSVANTAWARGIVHNNSYVTIGNRQMSFGFSVRCIKD